MRKILIVDDNEAFRSSVGAVLRREGYDVHFAAEGAAALTLYRKHPFDLVITDLIMPGKEGLETIMELHRLEPALKIIAMSGGGRMDANDYLPMAKDLGAAETLEKPFTSAELLRAVSNVWTESE